MLFTNNLLGDLHDSLHLTKAESNNSFIIHSKLAPVKKKKKKKIIIIITIKKKTGQNMFSSSFAFYSANSWYKGLCSSASLNSRCHLSSCILAVLSLFSGISWGVSSSQNTWNIWPKFCTAHQNNPTLSLALLSCCPLFGINFTCMLYFWWNCCCFVGSLQFSSPTVKQTKPFHSNFRDAFHFFMRKTLRENLFSLKDCESVLQRAL